MERVTVLGAGPAAMAMACSITTKGYDVAIFECPRFAGSRARIDQITKQGGLNIEGEFPATFVKLPTVSYDPEVALKDRDIYLIGVPAYGQASMMRELFPYLEKGRLVVFCSGSTASLAIFQEFSGQGIDFVDDVTIAETVTMPRSARFVDDGTLKVALGDTQVRVAAFPGKNTDEAIRRISPFINTKKAVNCFDTGLNNPNFIIHPAPMLLNYAEIERSKGLLSIMNEGMTKAVLACMDAVDAEKMNLLRCLGVEPVDVDSLYIEFGSSPDVYRKPGEPFAMKKKDRIWPRYTKEDIPYGMVQMASLGEMLNVPTPVCRGIADVLSVAEGVDYWSEGRTVEALGIAGMDVHSLKDYLQTGRK